MFRTISLKICPAALLILAIPALTMAGFFGHHHSSPPGPCPSAVVLDFTVAPRVSEHRDCCTRELGYLEKDVVTEKDTRGWWLHRQDYWVNSNVGRMAADIFAETLQSNCIYNITSREDLKYYYADKKDLLRSKFKLKDKELDKAILQLDPIAIGREMGVQKVIVAHICDSELRKAVAPGSFASVASLNIVVFDVATGRLEFDQCYRKKSDHSTQYFHYEKIAEEFTEDLRHQRGGTMVPAWQGR